eukprot:6457021-Amphidinium_carterae.2
MDVVVTIRQARVDELLALVDEALIANVLPVRQLRRLVGKGSSFATLLFSWRPFLPELYTALTDEVARACAPQNCCWTRQSGSLVRRYPYEAFSEKPQVLIVTDASPWGLGGLLIRQGVITTWYPLSLRCWMLNFFMFHTGSPQVNKQLKCWPPCEVFDTWFESRSWLPVAYHLHRELCMIWLRP